MRRRPAIQKHLAPRAGPLQKPQKKTIYIIMCVCVYLRVYTGNNTNTRRISHWEKWKEKKVFFLGDLHIQLNDKVKSVSTTPLSLIYFTTR
jgi:hypothetical protein